MNKGERRAVVLDAVRATVEVWGRCGSLLELVALTEVSYHTVYWHLRQLEEEGEIVNVLGGTKGIRPAKRKRASAEMVAKVREGVVVRKQREVLRGDGKRARGPYRKRGVERRRQKVEGRGPNGEALPFGGGWFLRRDYVQRPVADSEE